MIARALRDVGGDPALAADKLGLGYRTLLAKMKEHGLD
jgi:DNA-binding NtrC family response regulator